MNQIFSQFIESVSSQLLNSVSISEFMIKETNLRGSKFSFKGHEYQEYLAKLIENNPRSTHNWMKPSQIGLSELMNRTVLAFMAIIPGVSVLISFPSKTMSQEVLKTRIANVIDDSPRLKNLIDPNVDSASVKQFVNSSILYALGGNKIAGKNNSAINRPISICVADEFDRQDKDIVSSYRSRMKHAVENIKLVINLSTPTVSGVGIDAAVSMSKVIHTSMVVCDQCQESFEGDYYKHVEIPGYDGDLKLLTRYIAAGLPIKSSFLRCPFCRKPIRKPGLGWKVEENDEGLEDTIGVKLSPFVAPDFVTISDLVISSLSYTSTTEFINQELGKVADSKESSIQRGHIHFIRNPTQRGQKIFGLDMGKLCHYMRGTLSLDTTIHIEDAQQVKLDQLEEFIKGEQSTHVFTAGVVDSLPYTDLVMKFVKRYVRMYSAVYEDPVKLKPEIYSLKMTDKYDMLVRQITLNKNIFMDLLAGDLDTFFSFEPGPMEGLIIKHLLDMRRIRDYRYEEEMRHRWIKSAQGDDHFFHTLVYVFAASKLAAAGINTTFQVPFSIKRMKIN